MEGREIVSINGEIFDLQEGKVSVLDHCFLYGDGIFEGIRFIDGKILLYKEHVRRLYFSSEIVRLKIIPQLEFEKQLFAAIKASNLKSGYVRVIITRGIGALDINPAKCKDSKIIIIVANLKLYPEELYDNGLKVIVSRVNKIPYRSFDCRVKSCNYLNNIMATWEFIDRGASEAIQTDEQGIVSEATVDNIFGITNGSLFTPSIETNCLEGITREKIIEIAKDIKIQVEEGSYTVRKFLLADEVFLTGTGAGVIPVTQIEHRIIGTGKIGKFTKKLRDEYEKRIPSYSTPIK
jgi:branched-chain amino acid aminotransferase